MTDSAAALIPDPVRRAAAWCALATCLWLYSPFALAAFPLFWWVSGRKDPGGLWGLLAWLVWCLTGLGCVVGFAGGILSPFWGGRIEAMFLAVLPGLVLYEFYYLPFQQGGIAEFRRHLELFHAAQEKKDGDAMIGHARQAYRYAGRILWASQEPRAAAAYAVAQAELLYGDPGEALRYAELAVPAFTHTSPIEGISADLVFACRAGTYLALGRQAEGHADLTEAIRLRMAWAGEDAVVRAWEQMRAATLQ